MLSKAQANMPPEEMEAEGGGAFTPDEQADLKIASSILTQNILGRETSGAFMTAISSPEPAKAVATIIAQIMEMTITDSMQTDTPMSPLVWLSEDGAIDESEEDFEMLAQAAGVPLPPDFADMVVDEVAAIVQMRAQEEQGQGQQPPQGGGGQPMAPVPGNNQPMGGMV